MSILHNKRVVILGLGNHGGGMASAQFACRSGAAKLLISDMQEEEKLSSALAQLADLLSLPHVELETGRHSVDKILSADIVIKNPAIPHSAPIIQACLDRGVRIESDISLFLRELRDGEAKPAAYGAHRVMAVTGTKGKSSMVHAINRWNVQCGIPSYAAGNIAYSPLQLLMEGKHSPVTIVLELSSFQLGDLHLVQRNNPSYSLYRVITLAILTNILPDHQNYYTSMREYVQDKVSLFRLLSPKVPKFLPYELGICEYSQMLPILEVSKENGIMWHSTDALAESDVGAWASNDAIMLRKDLSAPAEKCCALSAVPKDLPLQNCIVFALFCSQQGLPCPQTSAAWSSIFAMPHRKEYIRSYKGRAFYNDSTASIPQAIQLHVFQKRGVEHVHLIAGGTDKNLNVHSFLQACKGIDLTKLTLHLLDGTYTAKILPLVEHLSCHVFGPFDSLEASVQSALTHSEEGDVIALSPGCASFGSFIHEFQRGEVFKSIVQAL